MPPITITHHEPDGDGGWYVHWHDAENLDGEPLDAFIHITPEKVDELEGERRLKGAPPTKMLEAKETLKKDRDKVKGGARLNIPDGVVPYAARDFIEGYSEHVKDSIDRILHQLPADAPHEALVRAREQGQPRRFGELEEQDTPASRFAKAQAQKHIEQLRDRPDPMLRRQREHNTEADEPGGNDAAPDQRPD